MCHDIPAVLNRIPTSRAVNWKLDLTSYLVFTGSFRSSQVCSRINSWKSGRLENSSKNNFSFDNFSFLISRMNINVKNLKNVFITHWLNKHRMIYFVIISITEKLFYFRILHIRMIIDWVCNYYLWIINFDDSVHQLYILINIIMSLHLISELYIIIYI